LVVPAYLKTYQECHHVLIRSWEIDYLNDQAYSDTGLLVWLCIEANISITERLVFLFVCCHVAVRLQWTEKEGNMDFWFSINEAFSCQ